MEDYEAAGVQGTRLYVGNLPTDATKRDLEQLFGKYGNLRDVSVKRTVSGAPFAFIEFEDERDGQEAIKGRDGYNYNGNRLRVEIPFASRNNGPGRGRGRGAPRRGEFRVLVSGLPPSGSWQDLKDHMRDAGECVYADVFRDGTGVVEFTRRDDWEYALKQFNDSKFRSHEGEVSRIQVRMCEDVRDTRRSPSPPGHNRNGGVFEGYRSSSGYRDEPRGDFYRDDGRGGYRDDYRVSNVGGGYRDDYRGSYRPDSRGGLRYGSAGGGRYSDEVAPPRYDGHRRASHHDDEFDRRSPHVPPYRSVSRGRSRSRSRR